MKNKLPTKVKTIPFIENNSLLSVIIYKFINPFIMKKIILLFLCSFLSFGTVCFGQNLVMNPSFEDTLNDCDSMHYFICENWVNPNGFTTEYYSPSSYLLDCYGAPYNAPQSFLGYQTANEGLAYLGMMLYNNAGNGKDFSQGFLSQSLVQGQTYHVAMYINMADSSNYKTCEIDMAFSNQLIYTSGGNMNLANKIIFDISDVDSIDWKLVTGTYVANGGEQYIYIGSNTDNGDLTCVEELSTGFTATQCAYYLIDNVYVSEYPLTLFEIYSPKITLYPNPASDKIMVNGVAPLTEYSIIDPTGKHIESNLFFDNEIDLTSIENGIYYLKINNNYYQININH